MIHVLHHAAPRANLLAVTVLSSLRLADTTLNASPGKMTRKQLDGDTGTMCLGGSMNVAHHREPLATAGMKRRNERLLLS
jgi:hypothetical protein